jgi:hypothetical protein
LFVLEGGFSWQGRTYPSLSAIAKEITGTRWKGPRFFGLTDEQAQSVALKTPEAAREEDLTAEGKVVRHIKAGLFTLLALPVFNVLMPLAELRHAWRRLTIKNPDA